VSSLLFVTLVSVARRLSVSLSLSHCFRNFVQYLCLLSPGGQTSVSHDDDDDDDDAHDHHYDHEDEDEDDCIVIGESKGVMCVCVCARVSMCACACEYATSIQVWMMHLGVPCSCNVYTCVHASLCLRIYLYFK
jgi:hypothetical protein